MPSKGSKAASRQAQLSRRKKRNRGRGQPLDQGPDEASLTTATAVEDDAEDAAATQAASGEQTPAQPVAVASAAPAPSAANRPTPQQAQRGTAYSGARRPAQPSRRAPQPEPAKLAYKYLGTELKQIAILTTLMVAILIGLTFVLRA
ncbi:MAG: hypothetical protein L0177_09960 [Chloroflexi bacterium]|nr:hypothetical protein [Chloroflexota bacterium]